MTGPEPYGGGFTRIRTSTRWKALAFGPRPPQSKGTTRETPVRPTDSRSAFAVSAAGALVLGALDRVFGRRQRRRPDDRTLEGRRHRRSHQDRPDGSSGGAVSIPQMRQGAARPPPSTSMRTVAVSTATRSTWSSATSRRIRRRQPNINDSSRKKVAAVVPDRAGRGHAADRRARRYPIRVAGPRLGCRGAPGGYMSPVAPWPSSGAAVTAAKAEVKFTILIGDSGDAAASAGQMAQPLQAGRYRRQVVVIPSNVADPTRRSPPV